MQNDPERIARWRERADQYRVCAAASLSTGARCAYRALAECADGVADRMECGTFKLKALDSSVPKVPAVEAATNHRGSNEPLN
jgi:hypothetical protein